MKKINRWVWISILLLPNFIFAADELEDGIGMVTQTGTLFGVIIVVVAVALWMIPIAFAGLVYSGQKKKAEQMHEEVGLKAAILALLAGVLGAALAYYVVGTIGMYSSAKADSLGKGNGVMIQAIVGNAVNKM